MKAISLWEPWASLIRTGAKTYETRSWPTHYRGKLLICAAKGGLSQSDLIATVGCWEMQGALGPLIGKPLDLSGHAWPGVSILDLHRGKAVAIIELLGCKKTEDMTLEEIGTDKPFGDFSLGRYAWKLRLIDAIRPFPVKGAQGFFNVKMDEEIIQGMEAGYPGSMQMFLPL